MSTKSHQGVCTQAAGVAVLLGSQPMSQRQVNSPCPLPFKKRSQKSWPTFGDVPDKGLKPLCLDPWSLNSVLFDPTNPLNGHMVISDYMCRASSLANGLTFNAFGETRVLLGPIAYSSFWNNPTPVLAMLSILQSWHLKY